MSSTGIKVNIKSIDKQLLFYMQDCLTLASFFRLNACVTMILLILTKINLKCFNKNYNNVM